MYKFLFYFLGITCTYAQHTTVGSRLLSTAVIDSIFTSDVKRNYDIDFEIYRGYQYNDVAESHIILMTENRIEKEGSSFRKEHIKVYNDSIKAYFFDVKNKKLRLNRTLTDFTINREYQPEYSIAYWTKFFELDDYDGDGIIDPILVYGTYGMNGTGDGRIKIIVLQNNKKIAIRHQNGISDYDRNTQVDAAFYKLPKGIQQEVIQQMIAIMKNDSGIFPSGWQAAMQRKALKFDEK